jgi:hypothetical protein
MDQRPTGRPFINTGIILFVVTLLGILFLAGSDPEQGTTARQWSSVLGGLFSLGLLLFAIGQIQRAIWFLPGGSKKR